MKALIKVLAVCDTAITYLPKIQQALDLLRESYSRPTNGDIQLSIEIIRQDLSNLPWEPYLGDTLGVSKVWLRQNAPNLPSGKHCVSYVIDSSNWKSTVYGWNVGPFIGGSQVQLVKGRITHSVESHFKTFAMEIAHAWNNWSNPQGISLEQLLGVSSYDESCIHFKDSSCVATPYQYEPMFARMKEVFIKLFPYKSMIKHIIEGGEQYIVGVSGEKFHIYNLAMLKALQELGLVGNSPEFSDGSIPDSGKELVILDKE